MALVCGVHGAVWKLLEPVLAPQGDGCTQSTQGAMSSTNPQEPGVLSPILLPSEGTAFPTV